MRENKKVIDLVDIETTGDVIDLTELVTDDLTGEGVIELTDLADHPQIENEIIELTSVVEDLDPVDPEPLTQEAEQEALNTFFEEPAAGISEPVTETLSRVILDEISSSEKSIAADSPLKIEISQEMLEKAVEKVVEKMFYQKIDNMLVDIIGRTVSRDIEHLKKIVLEGDVSK